MTGLLGYFMPPQSTRTLLHKSPIVCNQMSLAVFSIPVTINALPCQLQFVNNVRIWPVIINLVFRVYILSPETTVCFEINFVKCIIFTKLVRFSFCSLNSGPWLDILNDRCKFDHYQEKNEQKTVKEVL